MGAAVDSLGLETIGLGFHRSHADILVANLSLSLVMSMSTYSLFRETAAVGARVSLYIRADGGLTQKIGVVRRLLDDGVLLEGSGQITFLSGSTIETFSVYLSDRPEDRPEPSSPAPAQSELERAFEIFSRDPRVAVKLPLPDFSIPDLSLDDQSEVVRWKNRYEYSVKINELTRVTEIVPPMERLADRLRNSAIYLAAGTIAATAGYFDIARPPLLTALTLGSAQASAALAHLAIHSKDFDAALEFVCRGTAIANDTFGDCEASLMFIGRLLANAASKDIPGLESVVVSLAAPPHIQLSHLILAFALNDGHPNAAAAVAAGNLQEGRRLAASANIFKPLSALTYSPLRGPRETTAVSKSKIVEEYGQILSVFAERSFGFIKNDVTAEVLHFFLGSTADGALLNELEDGIVGQKVAFVVTPGPKQIGAKYHNARSVRLREQRTAVRVPRSPYSGTHHLTVPDRTMGGRAPLNKRLALLPKGEGPYAKAKRLEQMDDLAAAEAAYKDEIAKKGSYRQSAIKDLAMLLSRLERPDEAVRLLKSHWEELEPKRPVENLKASFLMKASRHAEAAEIFVSLHKSAEPSSRDSLTAARQAAYCYYVSRDFDAALKYLQITSSSYPPDASTVKLINSVKEARALGTASEADAARLQELAGLASITGLSAFAIFFIDKSDFKGADERSITRGFFGQRDFQLIERQMRSVRGRQPRMRGQLLQTLAAMYKKTPLEAGDRSIQDILRSCFLFMGEAAINDKLADDSVRCFFVEAAHLAARSDQVTDVARYLLSTYLSTALSADELSNMAGDKPIPIQEVIRLFEGDTVGWLAFVRDFPYYVAFARVGRSADRPGGTEKFFIESAISVRFKH